jgi:hypothetical protein
VKNHTNEWNTFTSLFIDWKVFIIIYCCYFFILFLFVNSFYFIICIFYSEIDFIKPLDDVKIQRKIITFTKDRCYRTVFINKMINSGIVRMFIFFITFIFIYSILLTKCYASAQISIILLVWKILFFFIVMILFFFYLIIWWDIGIASESKLEVLKDGWFGNYNCFYYFLISCLIILFHYYSIITYKWAELWFSNICGYKS